MTAIPATCSMQQSTFWQADGLVVCVLEELPAFYQIQIFNTVVTGSFLQSGSVDTFKTHFNTILSLNLVPPKCYNVFTLPVLNEACISCACRTFHKLRYLIALATFSKQNNHEAPIIQFPCPPNQWNTERGGGFTPHPEIPKALQNRARLNPIVKTVKNCWI